MFGDHELQHCVTQKLQALIVEIIELGLVSDARMGQCFREEERVSEFITNAFFERFHLGRKPTITEAVFPTNTSPRIGYFRWKIVIVVTRSRARWRTGSRSAAFSGLRPIRCAASMASSSGFLPD